MHAGLPELGAYMPVAHRRQLSARAWEYRPGAHGAQLVWPCAAWNVPALHPVQVGAPVAE